MIKKGSQVRLHYTLTVDEEQIESSQGKDPLAYVHGSGEIIPGLEEAMDGMAVGEKKDVVVPAEKGYGEVIPDRACAVRKDAFQDSTDLKEGDVVTGQVEGKPFRAKVLAVGAEDVTLDLNHPLAGKTLHFAVEIVGVE
jgi:FKBP-type peptidyl-prolyl cis-trans isomerase 2